MAESLRIRTNVNDNQNIIFNLDQDFDLIKILSLNITQEEVYRRFSSDYGVVVGRVLTNTNFGVPNAKVSIFIPVTDEDKLDPEIYRIYPFEVVSDKDIDGVRYNLLTPECLNECHTPIGTFPNKRKLLDNQKLSEVFDKYYKFTTTTNESGDYMLFGVPVGQQIVHLDVDISNIGILSQKPYNLIDQGVPKVLFDSPRKFKYSDDLDSLAQVRTINAGINVIPFWGDTETSQIGITRFDIDLRLNIEPSAFFIGSIFRDDYKNTTNKKCTPKRNSGKLSRMQTGEGNIEMIRVLPDGSIENYDVNGGRLIDEDGTWAYQIPMNLDRLITDEFGNLVASPDPNIGIATRAKVRFRIGFDDLDNFDEKRKTAKYLVPNNPDIYSDSDYSFDESTRIGSFADLFWNEIYTVKSFIPRYQNSSLKESKRFLGIKDVENDNNTNNVFPYNRLESDANPLVTTISLIFSIIVLIIGFLNGIIGVIDSIINAINFIIPGTGSDINLIPCVGIECNGDRYAPGCFGAAKDSFLSQYPNGKTTGLIECLCSTLSETFGLLEFNFYNDWINGSLYFPAFKYKKRKSNKEKFCEYDCDAYDPDSSNSCGNRYLLDTCGNRVDKIKINDGIIYKDDENDELYYASYTHTSNNKLFATDIINLGSIDKCHWAGSYKFIDRIPATTYREVPLVDEFENGVLDTTGQQELLYNIVLCGAPASINNQNCINLARICELGVGNDEDRSDETTNVLGVGGGLPDNKITNLDIEDLIVRDLLVLSNTPPSTIMLNSLSTIYHSLFSSTQYDGTLAYNIYRDYRNEYTILPRGNSFYFYFGLNQGKTAIDKFKRNYLAQCVSCKVNKLTILGDITGVSTSTSADGEIDIEVIGGLAPYTYEWIYNNTVYSTSEDLINLITGYYTVKVIDSNGLTAKKTFFVPTPLPLQCNGTGFDSTFYNADNGNILINGIGGGNEPYNVVITNTDTNQVVLNTVLSGGVNSVYATGTNTSNGTLTPNNYSYIVTDANGSTCGGNIVISEPPQLNLTVVKEDITCNGADDGSITLNISGGVPPYSYYVTDGTNSYTNNNNQGLTAGLYSGYVSDFSGFIINFTTNIIEPSVISFNDLSNNVSCANQTDGLINIVINGGTPPFTMEWTNSSGGSSNGFTIVPSTNIIISNIGSSNSGSTNPSIASKVPSIYNFTVLDSNNCSGTFTREIKEPPQLSLSLVSYTNTTGFLNNGSITVSGSGGNPTIGNGVYTYELIKSSVVQDTINTPNQTVTFSNLSSGTYTITLTDINGCPSNQVTIVVL